jgi:hypothetical protein
MEILEILDFSGAFLFGVTSPLVTTSIVGMWLVLLIRFGLLPFWLERSAMTSEAKKRSTKSVTRVVLGIVLIGILVAPFLCNPQVTDKYLELWYQGEDILGENILDLFGGLLFGPGLVPLAMVIEEWLVLICFFGLHHLLGNLDVPIDRRQEITWYTVVTILIIVILTDLVGIGWSIHTANVDPHKLDEVISFGLVVLSPTTGLLFIGLAVMLVVSLEKALVIEQSEEQTEYLARSMAVKLLLAFGLLSVVGGLWSASIYHLWMQGGLW